jgi:hypothetical protein
MTIFRPSPYGARRRALLTLLAASATWVLLLTIGASAQARSTRSHPSASISVAATSRSLRAAARAHAKADRALVQRAKTLKRCLRRHPRHCARQRRAIQRAGLRLARTQRRLSALGHSRRGNSRGYTFGTPQLGLNGQTLRWKRVAGINTYVVLSDVPGQHGQYTVVDGTSTTPPPVLGASVSYSVRTAAPGSAWAIRRIMRYPTKTSSANLKAAPQITVSNHTLSWHAVGGVGTYVFVSKTHGRADRYSVLSGTSTTPSGKAGTTVRYSVRTAVYGSAWAPEVAVTYPADGSAPSAPPSTPVTPPNTGSTESNSGASSGAGPFEMGVVAGSSLPYELSFIQQLGAHTARMEFSINTPVSQMEPVIDAYARAGIRPLLLAGFNARIPSTAEAQNLAAWAAAFGPNGSFWRGKSYPAGTVVTDIEFGNETNNPWQYLGTTPSDWYVEPAFLQRAENYALRFKDAQIAIKQANPNVGLLAIADQYSGYTTWVNAMFKAVPDLGQRVAGWTVHPYGPKWQIPIDTLIADTQALGAPSTVPIWATEWGLSSDNGRCLTDNFNWNPCMTYAEAAGALGSTVTAMRARYGSRLRALYLFQAHDQRASGAENNREYYFGALQSNGATKGPYTTEVQSLLAANP